MNQAMFSRILVGTDGEITVEFTELFEHLLDPQLSRAAAERAENSEIDLDELDRLWERAITGLRAEIAENERTADLVLVGGSNVNQMVGVEGLEPPTPSL